MATIAAIIGGVGALAGAGASLYSANQGANAAKRSNQLAESQFSRQMELSRRAQQLAEAGSVDARGNRTEFIPGVGWVETPTPLTRRIISASDNEELARLEQDAPRDRMRRENTFRRQLNEGGLADTMLARRNIGERTLDDARSSSIRTGIADAVAAPNEVRRNIELTALRQGSGGETALANLARQGMADRRSVLARADASAPADFAAADDARLNGPINRYSGLAARATADNNVSVGGTSLADNLTAARSRQQAVAGQTIGSAMNIRAPQIQSEENMLPVRLGSLGSALGGMVQAGSKAYNSWFQSDPQNYNMAGDGGASSAGYDGNTVRMW